MPEVPFRLDVEARAVHAWSSRRLAFEPKGWQLDFRAALRGALSGLTPEAGEGLHAVYQSSRQDSVDVENVLTYNVGLRHLASAARNGFTLERSFEAVSDETYDHAMSYVLSTTSTRWMHWSQAACVAVVELEGEVTGSVGALTTWRAAAADLAARGGPGVAAGDAPLLITLALPEVAGGRALHAMKPLTDGVLSACHRLSIPTEEHVLSRLMLRFPDAEVDTLRGWLHPVSAPLGDRAFLLPRAQGLQVSPADDRLVGVNMRTHPHPVTRAEIWTAEARHNA